MTRARCLRAPQAPRFRLLRANRPLTCLAALVAAVATASAAAAEPVRYLRYRHGEQVSYGLLEGDQVRKINGDLFGEWRRTETTVPLADVKLLPPTRPSQVLALAGNYRSHLQDDVVPPQFRIPQPFHKSPSCLIGQGDPIVIPRDATTVHYEAELVIVIGKRCRKVSPEQAGDYVLGVTAGNDISERIWQNDMERKDVQWWRAKGADTFGPCGPVIVSGLDYGHLMLRLRVNGELRQEENTDHLIHDIPHTISHISRYVTLEPGDLIFTGTPGKTDVIRPGDVVEVELEGVGVLRNPVVLEE